MFNFVPDVGVELLDTITSTSVTIDTPQTLSVQGGQLVKNGVVVSSPTSVVPGDDIAIRTSASSYYSTATYALVTTDINTEISVYFNVTKAPTNAIEYPQFQDLTPFDLLAYADGSAYLPSTVSNSYGVYSSTGSLLNSVSLTNASVGAVSASYYNVVADYFAKTVYLFASDTTLVSKRTYSTPVFGGSSSGNPTDLGVNESLIWISLPEENRVVGLDKNMSEVYSYNIGDRPLGLAVISPDFGYASLVIASANDQKLYVMSIIDGAVQSTLDLPGKPHDLVLLGGKAYVTLSDAAKLCVVDLALNTFTEVALPAPGLGITTDNLDKIYVACVDYIAQVSIPALTVSTLKVEAAYFLSVAVDGTNVYAADINTSKVHKILKSSFTYLTSFSVPATPYGLYTAEGNVVVASLYGNSPSLMFVPDYIPADFSLDDSLKIPRSFTFETNEITVDGIYPGIQVPVSIPNIYGAQILKNGLPAGTSTVVARDDKLKLQITTPSIGDVDFAIPLVVGGVYDFYTSTTVLVDATPDAFEFNDVYGQARATPIQSNVITISGLDPDASVLISAQPSTVNLYKNGVSLSAAYGNFVNGDTLKIGLTTPDEYCDIENVQVTAGTYYTVWTVTTLTQPGNFIKSNYVSTPLDEFPLVSGATSPNTANDSVAYLSSTLAGGITRINLNSVPTDVVSAQDYLTVLDKELNRVFLLDLIANNVAKSYTPPSGAIKNFDYYPKYSTSAVPTHIAVITAGGSNKIYLLNGNLSELYTHSPASAPSAVCATSNSTLLVAFPAESLVKRYTITNDVLALYDSFTIPGVDFIAEDSYGRIWVGSSVHHTLQVFNAAMTQIAIFTDVVAQGITTDASGNSYVADIYRNRVRVFNPSLQEVSSIVLNDPPSDVAVDAAGKIYVSTVKSNALTRYSSAHVQEATIALNATLLGIAEVAGMIYALESTSNREFTATTETLKSMDSLVIPFTDNVPVGAVIESNPLTVSGLTRATTFFAEPYPNISLIVNSVDVQSNKYVVDNGDVVQVLGTAPNTYYTQRDVRVGTCSSLSTYSLRTEPDLVPDLVLFSPARDQYVGSAAISNEILISGLTPGFYTDLTIDFATTTGAAYINGEITFENPISVTNGDLVSIAILVEGPYGSLRLYDFLRETTVLGEFKVVTITLDGAVLWPEFEQHLWNMNPQVLERDHYLTNLGEIEVSNPVIHTEDFPTRQAIQATGSYALMEPVVGLSALMAYALMDALGIESQVTSQSLAELDVIPLAAILQEWHLYQMLMPQAVSQDNTQLTTVDMASPEYQTHLATLVAMVSQTTQVSSLWIQDIAAPLPIYVSSSYLADMNTYSQYAYALLQGLAKDVESQVYTLIDQNGLEGASYQYAVLDAPIVYEQIQFDTWIFIDQIFEKAAPPTYVPITPIYLKGNESTWMFYEMLGLALVYDLELIEALDPISLVRTQYLNPALIADTISYRYGVGYYELGIASIVRDLQLMDGMESQWLTWSIEVIDAAQPLKIVRTSTEIIYLNSLVAQAIQHTVNGMIGEIDQDSISYCPPYGTCLLKGLYPDLTSAYEAAVQDSDNLRALTAVPFKGCYLWIEDPELDILQCSSVGPDDPFKIGLAWCLSQGPLKTARTTLQVARYKWGG